jgi:hypothetical protein
MKKLALPLLLFVGIASRVALTVAMNSDDVPGFQASATRVQPDSSLQIANTPTATTASPQARPAKP